MERNCISTKGGRAKEGWWEPGEHHFAYSPDWGSLHGCCPSTTLILGSFHVLQILLSSIQLRRLHFAKAFFSSWKRGKCLIARGTEQYGKNNKTWLCQGKIHPRPFIGSICPPSIASQARTGLSHDCIFNARNAVDTQFSSKCMKNGVWRNCVALIPVVMFYLINFC